MPDVTQEPPVTPEILLRAYANGYFPMADNQRSRGLYWFNPEIRAVLPLDRLHIPRSLEKFMRKKPFEVTVNQAFGDVIHACANARGKKRKSTWINAEIIALYTELHEYGHAHSVECWENNQLVGGVYGVSLGGAFFGESMFSTKTNASRIALVHLAQGLREAGYLFIDAQFENPHLVQFGFQSVPQADYLVMLRQAMKVSLKASSFFSCEPLSRS